MPWYVLDWRGLAAEVYRPLSDTDPLEPYPHATRGEAQRAADRLDRINGYEYTISQELPPVDASEELYLAA